MLDSIQLGHVDVPPRNVRFGHVDPSPQDVRFGHVDVWFCERKIVPFDTRKYFARLSHLVS